MKQYHPVVARVLAFVTTVVVAWLIYPAVYASYGSPYDNRAQGANGICPRVLDSTDGWIFSCVDETQRQAAAQVVAEQYHVYALCVTVAVGFLTLYVIMWALEKFEEWLGYARVTERRPQRLRHI